MSRSFDNPNTNEFTKTLVRMDREITALKTAKQKSLATLSVVEQTSTASIYIRRYDTGYIFICGQYIARYTVTPSGAGVPLCACTIDKTSMGSYTNNTYVQPFVERTIAEDGTVRFEVGISLAADTYVGQNYSLPLRFTCTSPFTLAGPTYIDIGWETG